jgi:hypothetical protein
MSAKKSGPSGPDDPVGTPENYPVPTPRGLQGDDRTFLLQNVLDLQKTTGQLTQAVATLTKETERQRDKLDSISHRMYGAAAVVAAIGAVLYFFLDRMWTQILRVLQSLPPVKP